MTLDALSPIVAAAAALLVGTAVAHADPPDAQFLGLLSSDGMNVSAPDRMIAIAHERCDDEGLSRATEWNWRFGGHPSPYAQSLWKVNAELEAQGLTAAQVEQFARDAIIVYCPRPPG